MQRDHLITEFTYRTSRSSGAGGQHVNKTETKVEALFYVQGSNALNEIEKQTLMQRYAEQISTEGYLTAVDQTTRSQLKNKEKAIAKLVRLVEKGIVIPKKRRIPPVPQGVKEARLREKKSRSEVKAARQKPIL